MKTINEVAIQTLFISFLNIFAAYLAAFVYKLNWSGVLTVMSLVSIITAGITHLIVSKMNAKKGQMINEGISVLGTALFSSFAVLVILLRQYTLHGALGISLVSGLLSSLFLHTLRV